MADPASASPSKWADLGIRAISAAVLIPAVIADVWAGGIWSHLFVALIGILRRRAEWVTIVHDEESGAVRPPRRRRHVRRAAAARCRARGRADRHSHPGQPLRRAGLLPRPRRTALALLGVLYVALPPIALVLLREDPQYGIAAIIWVMVAVWMADTLAYFAGRIIGGPKLAPRLSPKKTWAGLGGAMAGSALAAVGVALALGLPSVGILAALAAALAVVEQGGDLFKSAMKRHYGVKDSGRLIPGHGGVIDRVDGLVAVAMAAALIGALRAGVEHAGAGILVW